jgi:hypothetical protein
MLGILVSGLCGFLSVSVVVLGVCRGVFCVGFVGVVCLCVVAWGVVVVVLVEVGFGVGLRFCVAQRFINWISALHSLLGGRVERFDRCKTSFTRRFINADTYITYISMCTGAVHLAAYAGRTCGDAAPPTSGNMSRDVEFKHVSVAGGCGEQSRRS